MRPHLLLPLLLLPLELEEVLLNDQLREGLLDQRDLRLLEEGPC